MDRWMMAGAVVATFLEMFSGSFMPPETVRLTPALGFVEL